MAQSIILKRKIDQIHVFYVKMKILVKKPAEFYGIIVGLALENNSQLSETILVEQLQFTYSMAKTTLNRCYDMKLIDKNYNLTEMGRKISEEGKMYQPEENLYKVYLTSDPLLPQRVIGIQRVLNDKNIKNIDTQKKNLNLNNKEIHNLLMADGENDKGGFIHSDQIIIEDCAPNLITESNSACDLYLDCQISPTILSLKLKSTLNKRNFSASLKEIPSEFTYPLIFTSLLGSINLINDWEQNLSALKVEFDRKDISRTDYLRFKHIFKIPNPSIPNFGTFQSTKIQLEIIPKNTNSMLYWELELLFDKINEIITTSDYQKLHGEIRELMQNHAGESISLPSLEKIAKFKLEKYKQNQEYGPRETLYWYLQTSIDLPFLT